MNREIVAEKMLRLVEKPNQLKLLMETENWTKQQVIWRKMEAQTLKDFPKLTHKLRNLTLGIYQVKQTKSYTEEHLN